MKRHLIGLAGLFILISSFALQGGLEEVISALKSGNAGGVAKHFDSFIDITLPDKSSNYSKSQGELVIKDFFTNNGVRSFDVKHRGSNDNGEYCIGTLQSKNGNFRTTVFMRNKGSKQVIQDIRIE